MTTAFFDEANFNIIVQEFGVSRSDFAKHVNKLHAWLISQPHLPHDVEHAFLQKFVVHSRFSLEKATRKMERYYTVRRLVPGVFANRDPLSPEIIDSNACMHLGFLPGLTDNGARCAIVRLRDPDPDRFNMMAFLRRWYFMMDVWLRNDTFVNKIYVIVDAADSSIRHMVRISPKKFKENAFCYQDVYPVRLEGVIFLNAGTIMKVLLEKLLKPMLKERISRKFKFHSNTESEFMSSLPSSMVPREYGGEAPQLEEINNAWIGEINRNREWLMSHGSALVDEENRQSSSVTEEGFQHF